MLRYYVTICPECEAKNFVIADGRMNFPYHTKCSECNMPITFNEMSDIVMDIDGKYPNTRTYIGD